MTASSRAQMSVIKWAVLPDLKHYVIFRHFFPLIEPGPPDPPLQPGASTEIMKDLPRDGRCVADYWF
jgi:hypothetical protein